MRPWRLVRTLWNALRGRETSKMETYLVDVRRKIRVGLRALFGRRSATGAANGPGPAAPAPAAPPPREPARSAAD